MFTFKRMGGIHFGFGYEKYELGTHHEKGNVYRDTSRLLYCNLLFWSVQLRCVKTKCVGLIKDIYPTYTKA